MEKPIYMSEVCECLRISENTVRRYCDPKRTKNPMPCHRPVPNGKRWFMLSEIEAWMNSKEPGKPTVRPAPVPGKINSRKKTKETLEFRPQLAYD